MKKHIFQLSDNYLKVFQKTKLLSQIPVFILSVTAFFELSDYVYQFSKTEDPADWVIPLIIRSFLITMLLSARFFLLFSKSKLSFYISQTVWLVYFVLLWNTFILHHHPSSFELFVWFYLFGSLFRQIVSLISAVYISVEK